MKGAVMKSPLLGFVVLGLASGCYLTPGAVQNPQPSAEGVAVTLVGQDCEDHRGGKGDPVSRELALKVRVENPTGQMLHVAEGAIRLLVDGSTGGVRFPAVIDVQPHASATLTLEFTHHSLCEPNRQFAVAWNDALVLDSRPITVANLTFHP
jgi:hypothetical protein